MTLGSLLGGLAAGAIVCGLFLSFQQSLTACPPESNAEGASTQRSVSLGASLMGADINEYGWLVKDEDYQTFLDILTDPRFIPDLNLPPWNANNEAPLRWALLHTPLLPGLFVECGVFTGGSIRWTGQTFPSRKIYGFDSFEGLPEVWRPGFDTQTFNIGGNLPEVPSNVELVKGWFENTLPPWAEAHKGETIAFLHVDCDIYSSTVTILRTLQPLLRPGSLIVFDDMYGYVGWDEHEAKALYEFLRVSNFRLLGVGKTGPARRYSDKALGDVGEAQQSYPLQPAAYIVW